MKRVLFLGFVALLASCSSSKYAANFRPSNQDYGYHKVVQPVSMPAVTAAPSTESLIASTSKEAGLINENPAPATPLTIEQMRANYLKLSAKEQKEFKKELRKEIKSIAKNKVADGVKSVTSVKKSQQMDHDLRLAAIFGAVGVVALLISGNAFYIIGAVALIIGVVFFVMWLTRQ